MKTITLQGMPNTGKTSTLNLAYDMLIASGGISTNRQPLGGDPNDFSDIVNITVNGINQQVAFYTMGDFSTYLADAIKAYAHQGCDVLVCAISTNTPKIRANKALNQLNATRINKTVALTPAVLAPNTADAQTIFQLI
jgi:hypothetical protein